MLNETKTICIPKGYIKCEELKDLVYISDDLDNETLGKVWRNYDFEKAEEYLYELQCRLCKATYKENKELMIYLQNKICFSSEARMLSVRKVAEISKSCAGVDKVVWRRDSDKMKAAISLNNGLYKAKPLRQFMLKDLKSGKERYVGVPTVFDRAMQVLYAYALEPIAESTGDKKSFAFRKGRSPQQAHAFLMDYLNSKDAPEWILITDIKAYYDTISHNWLLENIPIKKNILKEFLDCGFMFNGEVFHKDEGISLGSNLSTILGNMTLDGLQEKLYSLQGENILDYKNGYCIRFADDVCVGARTEEDAIKFKNEIISFLLERGLRISEQKTKIVNIKKGFEFLARDYVKMNGVVRCFPSERAVDRFAKEIEDLIYFYKNNWSQNKLIQVLNDKIVGFATYHKFEESLETFKYLDVIINALLLDMMKDIYTNLSKEQIIKRFWKKDSWNRNVFSLPNNRDKCLKNMADTILIWENKIDVNNNVFLDRNYFEELSNQKEIQNCGGRYKKVWERQEGKCFICSKPIKVGQQKDIIFKRNTNDKTIRNIAYVHSCCKNSVLEYAYVDDANAIDFKELLENIDTKKVKKKNTNSKFINLEAYFHNLKKKKVTLTFQNIEKILKFKLCDSAYKYRNYFTENKKSRISETWLSQGYKIKEIDMKNQKIEFIKFEHKRKKIIIPKYLFRNDLDTDIIEEINRFFRHIEEKYRLR